MNPDSLPRLLYLGDVPIQRSFAGAVLLYRLLEGYPGDKLHVIQPTIRPPAPELRLPGVTYHEQSFGSNRLLRSRFASLYKPWLAWRAMSRARKIPHLIKHFQPEAILTVTNGVSWMTAAAVARIHQLPLHLVLHDVDDWQLLQHACEIVRKRVETSLRQTYQQAASRLCVSPFMEEIYHTKYGVPSTVMYPARAGNAPSFAGPPDRLRDKARPLVCGYAGSIGSPGYVRAVKSIAEAMAAVGGTLLIHGPMSPEAGARAGLIHSNIRWGGMISSNELVQRFRREVDLLFAPMSFDAPDRFNMEVSFPSKLADYTAIGLPLVIFGPPYASAVRWARENPEAALVIDSEDAALMGEVVKRLVHDPELRMQLAEGALAAGNKFFCHEKSMEIFMRAITTTGDSSRKPDPRPNPC